MDRVEPYLDSMQDAAGQVGQSPWPSSEGRDIFNDFMNDEGFAARGEYFKDSSITERRRTSRSPGVSEGSSADRTIENEQEEPPVQADIVYTLDIRRSFDDRSPARLVSDDQMRQDVPFDIQLCAESSSKPGASSTGRTSLPLRRGKSSKILEIITEVVDGRHSSREMTELRRLKEYSQPKISELRLSCIKRRAVAIHSEYLKEILHDNVEYYPEAPSWRSPSPIEIEEPLHVLMHHYPEVERWIEAHEKLPFDSDVDSTATATRLKHMQVLRRFLQDRYQEHIRPTLEQLSAKTPSITFEMLWFLFRPGIDVYFQASGGISAAVIHKVEPDNFRIDKPHDRLYLKCWRMASDGSRVARIWCTRVINRYEGCRDVTSLPMCPTDIWDVHDNGSRRAKIKERNKIYVEALKKGSFHVQYDGPDLSDGRHYSGKIVIDHSRAWTVEGEFHAQKPVFDLIQDFSNKFAAYDRIFINAGSVKRTTQRGKKSSATTAASMWSIAATAGTTMSAVTGDRMDKWDGFNEDDRSDTLTDHQLFLLQPEALAFALSAKEWMCISMDHVRLLEPSQDSIDNLVLVDPHALETVQALSAKQNSASRSWSADFIEGKGTGQIILLHGPPGVGKTYTVESIAAWLQRPLLALTVADIGTKEIKVEQELLKWLDIAEAWNAVLLVDEADIFLEQRKTRDLARNGLVSAFLRRMEYFSGLLFLTTNRVGQIDDAFMSRVHVAIGYEGLTHEARQKIWIGFFKKLKKDRGDKVFIGKNAQEYILNDEDVRKIELNGREIRNALQTALTLAEYDNVGENKDLVIIEEGHFRKVLGMADKFHKYVRSIRRENEAKRAQGRGDRNDFGLDDET